jgi:hypothetical protein
MNYFTLIGYPTLVFRIERRFINVVGSMCVHGITLDGKRQTVARVLDVCLRSEP